MNRTIRCPHKFAVHLRICPSCFGLSTPRDTRQLHNEILVPGFVVSESTLVQKLGPENVEMRCGCGETFITTRRAIYKVRNKGSRCCCAGCRRGKKSGRAA